MKKIIIYTLICLIGTLHCFAEDSVAKTFTIDDAIKYATENSLEMSKSDTLILSKQYSLYSAKNAKKNMSKLDVTSLDVQLVRQGYYSEAAQMSLDAAQRGKLVEENKLKIQVKSDFYTYINSIENVNICEENLKSTNEKLETAKVNLQNGSISELDYKNFELSCMSAENSLTNAKNSVDVNLIALKNTMNYPLDKELNVIGNMEDFVVEYKEPDEAIKLSREQDTYKSLVMARDLAELKWKNCKSFYSFSAHEYKIEKSTYETALSDFTINVNNLDLKIRKAYNDLISAKNSIEYSDKSLEVSKLNTQASYLKYQMGMISSNDYRDIEQKYFSDQNTLKSAKLKYLTGALEYKSVYTLE